MIRDEVLLVVLIIQLQLLLFSHWEIVLKQTGQVEASSLTVGQRFLGIQNLDHMLVIIILTDRTFIWVLDQLG